MLRKLAFVVGSASLVAASVAHALGLGDIKPGSGLNQPLNAEIELVALRGVAPEEIRATLASGEEFDKAGIERVYVLNDLKMVVQPSPNGEAVIKLRTSEAVREPFLNFIVELNWPNGRLLREYTLLLDPPVFADEAPVVAARARTQPTVTSSGAVTAAPVSRPSTTSEVPVAPVGNTLAGSNSYGPISSSDTLWSIASRVRPDDSVTVQQTLVAILKANPQAFINNNPNQMRQGETLRIPSAQEIAAVPHRRALAEFVGAGAVVETARRSSGGAGTAETSGGRLTLASAPENFSTGKGGASREAAEVLNQENEALRGEIGKLVDKNKKLEKLVQLKDQQLASVGGESGAKSPSTVPEPAADLTPELPSTAPTDTASAADTSSEPVAAPVEEPKPVEKPKKKPVTPAKPVEEPSFLEDLLGENAIAYLLGLLGLIVAAVGFLFWKRRQVAEENFQESLLPLEPEDESNMRIEDDLNLPEVGEDFLAPPTSAGAENIAAPVEPVADPLGESDIYIAYGKYEQAEQLLLRALQDQPHRHELRLKLLECYAEMQDQHKFRDQVAMFQDAIDADPQLAKQVDKLQQRAWPSDHFSTKTAPTPLPTADDIFSSVGVGAASKPAAAASAAVQETSWSPSRKESVASDFDNDGEFNLDLDADLSQIGKAEEPAAVADDLSLEDSEFSFDLDESAGLNSKAADDWQPELEPTPVRSAAAETSFDLDDMDAGLPSGDELGMGDIDEIATKLDLARAYIEMHEVDGAKEILQEVLSEGNAQQKQEAQALLAKL